MDAVGIGVAVRDLTIRLPRPPAPDAKVRAEGFAESGGGPVPTALVTLARMGRRCAFGGVVGRDPAGDLIAESIAREGVGTAGLARRDGWVSPTSVILVHDGGRSVCEWRQEDLPYAAADLEPLHASLESCRYLLIDARMPEAQIEAARMTRRHGGRVLLDCGHPRPGVDELLGLCDIAIVSHSYPASGTGADPDPAAFLEGLRWRLAPDGPRIAGMTLGPEGCIILDEAGKPIRVAGIRVEAVDTTGAGDVFHGAFVHALLDGEPIPRAASFANAAAAHKCLGLTGRAPIPGPAEIRRTAETGRLG